MTDVIIPAFNASKYITETLLSVVGQTHKPDRIIVINDGSSDNTVEIVTRLAEIHPLIEIHNFRNAGLSTARNRGIQLSTSDYIAFCDADDVWHPDKLEKQMQLMQSRPDIFWVYCAYMLIDENSNPITKDHIVPPRLRGMVFHDLLAGGNLISGSASAVLIRRECFAKAGGFNPLLTFGEDLDMWLRLSKRYECDFLDIALVKIRKHSQSMQHNKGKKKDYEIFVNHLKLYGQWRDEDENHLRPIMGILRNEFMRLHARNFFSLRFYAFTYTLVAVLPYPLFRKLFDGFRDYQHQFRKYVIPVAAGYVKQFLWGRNNDHM